VLRSSGEEGNDRTDAAGPGPRPPEIDGLDIHFIHARSKNPGAMPLMLTHGWPGSIAEFLELDRPAD
jgi:pimeloyl-ACP methyl ester carboxylesterase